MRERLCMLWNEDCRTAVFGKTERTVGWEGDGELIMAELVRHCCGKLAETDRLDLTSLSHSFTLDCNIYVCTRTAAERVMKSITNFLANKLHLQVNAQKSAAARVWERKFLGYSLSFHRQPKLKVAAVSLDKLKAKLREHFRQARGRNVGESIKAITPLLRGWINYFQLAEVKGVFEELDGWIRRKYRNIIWRQWKRPTTRAKNLMKRGLEKVRARKSASNGRGAWYNSGASHMNQAFPKSYFDKVGLVSLLDSLRNLQLTS